MITKARELLKHTTVVMNFREHFILVFSVVDSLHSRGAALSQTYLYIKNTKLKYNRKPVVHYRITITYLEFT